MNRNTAPVEANGDLYAEQAPAPPRPDDHAAALSSPHRRGGGDSKLDLHEHAGILGRHGELIFAFLSGAALAVGWLIERGGGAALPFYAAAYFFGGYFTLREAIGNIAAKRFRIDTLMLVAADRK